MKKYIIALLALFIASAPVAAEDSVKVNDIYKQELELTRASLETQRKSVILQNLQLSESEASAFWKVYNDYRTAMGKVGDRQVKVINDYADAFRNDGVSEKVAGKLLDRYLNVLQDQIKVKKKFSFKFKKAISAKNAARFYQIDNRLDLLLNMQISKGVPLMGD